MLVTAGTSWAWGKGGKACFCVLICAAAGVRGGSSRVCYNSSVKPTMLCMVVFIFWGMVVFSL